MNAFLAYTHPTPPLIAFSWANLTLHALAKSIQPMKATKMIDMLMISWYHVYPFQFLSSELLLTQACQQVFVQNPIFIWPDANTDKKKVRDQDCLWQS